MAQTFRDLFWLVLLPVSWLYSVGVSLCLRTKRRNSPGLPVLSVGNIHFGGTGKTPLVIQLANHLIDKKTAILSRGYKSQSTKEGVRVDTESPHGPRRFGDEPWVMSLATKSDVFVGANRFDLIKRFKIANQYQLVLLDDGFQHVQLNRSHNLLILPGDDNPWEAACFPLGELREGFSAIKRATTIIITCSNPTSAWVEDWKTIAANFAPGIPCHIGVRKLMSVKNENGERLDAKGNFGAFCAIGRPRRFFEDISKWAPINYFESYQDHHAYTQRDVQALIKKAKEHAVDCYITTTKDFYKTATFFKEFDFPLLVASVEYELSDAFWRTLDESMEQAC